MKKKIWIWNHYATSMFFNKNGRHYNYAKQLINAGYDATIFCANTFHGSEKTVEIDGGLFSEKEIGSIKFVFVKVPKYNGNGFSRIRNIVSFYYRVQRVARIKARQNAPDVIIASSVHPLTCIAGIRFCKRSHIPCIVEIRDPWPLVFDREDAGRFRKLVIKILYKCEKWIYRKADKVVFTAEGGAKYIIDKKWDKANGGPIDISNIHYLNHGVDLNDFDYKIRNNKIQDPDLNDPDTKKFGYIGAIRYINGIGYLLDAAKYIKNPNAKVLIWGKGSAEEAEMITGRISEEKLSNVVFKGELERKYVPYVSSKLDAGLVVFRQNMRHVFKYGTSHNKTFEYMAAGLPVIANNKEGFCKYERYQCGIADDFAPEEYAKKIDEYCEMPEEEILKQCENARRAAENFEYKQLSKGLIRIIESVGEKSG